MKQARNLRVSVLAAALAIGFVACRQEQPKGETQATTHGAEYVSASEYNAMVAAKNATEDTLYQTINEIDKSLRTVSEMHGLMAAGGEGRLSKKEQIMHTISDINSLLEQNKARIRKLNGQLATLRRQKKGWAQESAAMRADLVQKEVELAGLQQQAAEQTATINYLNQIVNDLKQENTLAQENAKRMDTELHKAYYALGSYKELRDKKVLEKKGGILGLGRTARMKSDFTKDYFTEIDTRQVTTIPVNSKKAKLVTHHPVGSYEWEKSERGDASALTIKDPDKFWATSRYLVVEVK
jgi:hypothetical protein